MASQEKIKPTRVGHYKFHDAILGKGNFACVYKANHKLVGCDVALKVINVDEIEEEYVYRNLTREARILRGLRHPNIIRLYETVESESLYCLALELVRGSNLTQFIKKQEDKRITEKQARVFFYQMLAAVEYMHRMNYIHRDLKQENILIESGHVVKIVDFGLSNVYYPCYQLRTHCGSAEYAAPELFRSHSVYGTPADLWSLGVILYAMVIGGLPFTMKPAVPEDPSSGDRYRQRFVQRISKGLMQDNWEKMEGLSAECWDFLHDLLQPDQFCRIRIGSALVHHWIIKDSYLKKRLPQRRRDLYRQFEPEIADFLSDKLSITKEYINKHLHSRHDLSVNGKITSLFYMIRDTLVKDVLYPPKNIELSFLYRFEIWRKNRSMLSTSQRMNFGDHLSSHSSIKTNDHDHKTPRKKNLKDKDIRANGPESYQSERNLNNLPLVKSSNQGLNLPKMEHRNKIEPEPEAQITTAQAPFKSYKQSRPKIMKFQTSDAKESYSSKTPDKSSKDASQDRKDKDKEEKMHIIQKSSIAKKISIFEKLNTPNKQIKVVSRTHNTNGSYIEKGPFNSQMKPNTFLGHTDTNSRDVELINKSNRNVAENSPRIGENKRASKVRNQSRNGELDTGMGASKTTRTPSKIPITSQEFYSKNLQIFGKKEIVHNKNNTCASKIFRDSNETHHNKLQPALNTNEINIPTMATANELPKNVIEISNGRKSTSTRNSVGFKINPVVHHKEISILKNNQREDRTKGRKDLMTCSHKTPQRNVHYGPFMTKVSSPGVMQFRRSTVAERIGSYNGDTNERLVFLK